MRERHPVTEKIDFQNHRTMAAWWGDQCIRAIRDAIANPRPTTIDDLALLHAVRSARIALWHALKVGRHRHADRE